MILFCWAEAQSGERQRSANERSVLLLLAKKALNFFEVFIFTSQTDVRWKCHFSLSIDEKRSGQRFHAAVKLANRIVAQQDAIIHLVSGHIGLDRVPAVFVHGNADDGEPPRFILLLEFDEPGNFESAGAAPGSPKVE